MRTAMSFVLGALAASLIAAAAFRGGGQPLDSTFTYQGQLRNAGQLVNGTADLRFTLWDSDAGGMQVGTANTFNAYPLTDGRFALGLNFGAGAFNGDQRWVQVEFRNPAGVGQYLTLSPRDKINATPYALYALNGAESQWSYNPKTQALSAAQNVAKVGIGTSEPTAALEVVAAGGDDAVKLPAGSIGAEELSGEILAASTAWTGTASIGGPPPQPGGWMTPISREFTMETAGTISIVAHYGGAGTSGGLTEFQILVDGEVIADNFDYRGPICASVTLQPGSHTLQVRSTYFNPCSPGGACYSHTSWATALVVFTPRDL